MGIERMVKDVPCNIPDFTIMDAGAKWDTWPIDSTQAHKLSLSSKESMEREGKEKQRKAWKGLAKKKGKQHPETGNGGFTVPGAKPAATC